MIVIRATTVTENAIVREAAIAVLKSFLKARIRLINWPTRPSRKPPTAANFLTDSIARTTEFTFQLLNGQTEGINRNRQAPSIFSHLIGLYPRFFQAFGDTNALAAATPHPQEIEVNGRPVRARTADLHRVKVAL